MEILRIILICLAMVQLVGSITMIGSGIKGDGFALSPLGIVKAGSHQVCCRSSPIS